MYESKMVTGYKKQQGHVTHKRYGNVVRIDDVEAVN